MTRIEKPTVGLAVLFLLLAILILGKDGPLLAPLDATIAAELHEKTSPIFSRLMTAVSLPGRILVAVPLTIGAAALLFLFRRGLEAAVVLASGSNLLISSLLKLAVGRMRPLYEFTGPREIVETFQGFSFPSGHATFYASFFGLLAYLAWRNLGGSWRWLAVTVCTALIALVGPSRVYLGAHFASDVLGGYLVGGILLLVLVYAYEAAMRRLTP